MRSSLCFAGALLFLAGNLAQAATSDAVDRGFYLDFGNHTASVKNTFTGQTASSFTGDQDHNSFFVFDLASLSPTVSSGVLQLNLEGYFSPDPSETVTLYDVSTPTADLRADQSGRTDIYHDLKSGSVYGSAEVHPGDVGTLVDFVLSPSAVNALNSSAGGFFAVGLHLSSLSGPGVTEGVRWSNNTEPQVDRLVLNMPEQNDTFLLSAFSMSCLMAVKKFRRPV